jgi:hypothetical protein
LPRGDTDEDGNRFEVESLRDTAERLLAVHPLRAADAFQLAAALGWCGGRPSGHAVVALAARLRDAASREGFDLYPEDGA